MRESRTSGAATAPTSSTATATTTPKNQPGRGALAVDALTDPRAEGNARAPGTQRQTGRRIVVKVKVQAKEELTAKATGKIKVNPTYKLRRRRSISQRARPRG